MRSYTQEKESKDSKIKTDMDSILDPYLDKLIEQTKESTKYKEPELSDFIDDDWLI